VSSTSIISKVWEFLTPGRRHLRIVKILLDVAIGVHLILIPVILVTGGFKISFLGISLQVIHLASPIRVLLPLILIRAAIVVETKNFLLLGASLFIGLCSAEIVLRVHPVLLGDLFANKVLSKYNNGYDGIYEYDPVVKMNFMKPNFETIAYWNRYKWVHKTDSWGFRNPVDRNSADVVLLGDSLIYGHGVNQNQTVGHFLERITNHSVMNLGRQGDCAFQEVYILNKYGFKFRPRYVLYFFYTNDISDLGTYLSQDEMKQFIETQIENITFKDRSLPKRVTYPRAEKLIRSLGKNLYITESINYAHQIIKQKSEKKKTMSKNNPSMPAIVDKLDKSTYAEIGNSLEWKYTKKSILQMQHVSDVNNAVFVIVPITFGNTQQFNILKNIASENNIPFIDTRAIDHVRSYRLPGDGHFTGEGALALAKIVAKYLP